MYLERKGLQNLEVGQVPVLEQPAVQAGGEVELLAEAGATVPLPQVEPGLAGPHHHELLLLGQLPVRQEGPQAPARSWRRGMFVRLFVQTHNDPSNRHLAILYKCNLRQDVLVVFSNI